ncbi:hypothetical protein ABPG72_020785 [Tetrahymena utriculariae]
MKKINNELILSEKVKVIDYINDKHSYRDAAQKFNISTGTVSNIMKREDEYKEQLISTSFPDNRLRKISKTNNEDINLMVWEWFSQAIELNIPISGPIIQQTALNFATKLGKKEFQASNGWLECFKKRHDIVCKVINGESLSADLVSATNFKEQIKEKCKNYHSSDIFNVDETSLFFRAMPNKTLIQKYKEAKGGKYSKERLTILFGASILGEKLQPLVIGKSQKPRCFKNIKIQDLPVKWKANQNSWMTSSLFEEWLKEQNKAFKSKNRNVLLFLDNAKVHPNITLSNIKLEFLPPNTTSLIQPLDQGIIKNFKTNYRNIMVKHYLSKIESSENYQTNQISVLDSLYWISQAWSEISLECIQNCFRHAGFIEQKKMEEQMIDEIQIENNRGISQFYEQMQQQIDQQQQVQFEEFISFDNQLSISTSPSNSEELTNQIFIEYQFQQGQMIEEDQENEESDEEINEEEDNFPSLTYDEVNQMVLKLKVFAIEKESSLLLTINKLQNQLNEINLNRSINKIQITLDQFCMKIN